MYLRKTLSKRRSGTYTNHLLVESVRTPKGPRQKTVVSLGDLSPRPRGEWLKLVRKVERALGGQEDLFEGPDDEVKEVVARARRRRERVEGARSDEVVSVCAQGVETEEARQGGAVHVGHEFWGRLGLDGILAGVGLGPRARRVACAMVMNRLIHPGSEHAMPGWIRRTALGEIVGEDFSTLAEDALYRNLDRLHPCRAGIESRLAAGERTLFGVDQTVYLYDVTSTYFEGQALGNPKACRGHSRDKRPDCKQVVVGLVVDREGFPVAHEVFKGNTQDRQTLEAMLELLHERVGLEPGQTVVVDRGMSGDAQLELLESRGLQYVVATRQGERLEWLEEFEDPDGFTEVVREPSAGNRYQAPSRVRVKTVRRGDQTWALCVSSDRAAKDRAIREKHEERMVGDLGKLAVRIRQGRLKQEHLVWEAIGRIKERYPRVARYYRVAYDAGAQSLSYEVDEPRRSRAQELDGSYVLKTKRQDLEADELWRIYMLLSRAEAAFRAMKSPLAERPIFHRLEHRVETHIFLCVLAYHLLVSIEKTLSDKGVHTSWATVRDTLSTHQVVTVVLPTDTGEVLRIRKGSVPEPCHRELYDLLGVPYELMRPHKTWSRASPGKPKGQM